MSKIISDYIDIGLTGIVCLHWLRASWHGLWVVATSGGADDQWRKAAHRPAGGSTPRGAVRGTHERPHRRFLAWRADQGALAGLSMRVR
jgi:hypothetical protein